MLTKQKNLKNSRMYKEVFIREDLTRMRNRLRLLLKEKEKEGHLSEVRVREGQIFCKFKGNHVTIANPDDLFKVDIDNPDLQSLGLPPSMA